MNRVNYQFLLYGLLSLVFACKRESNTGAVAPAATYTPPAEVRLGYFPNVTHAQAVLGVTSGDFATAVAPVKFSARPFNAGPSLVEALFSGQIDVGYVGPGPAINAYARSHGDGIRVISGAADNGVLIVARKESGIHTLADLNGKKLATPQHGNTQDIAARHYLQSTLHQDNLDNVLAIANADQASLMSAGKIDAAWVPEPWGSLLIANAGAVSVAEEKDLWPAKDFSLTVIVTTPDFLKAHPDVVQKLLGVNHTWTTRLASEPAKYVSQLESALKTLNGKALPAGVTADAVSHVKFTEDPSPETFDANAQWSLELGFAKSKPDLSGLIDLSVLKKLP